MHFTTIIFYANSVASFRLTRCKSARHKAHQLCLSSLVQRLKSAFCVRALAGNGVQKKLKSLIKAHLDNDFLLSEVPLSFHNEQQNSGARAMGEKGMKNECCDAK